MPRQQTIRTTTEDPAFMGGREVTREYRITYLDDSKERAEAVKFFGRSLFPTMWLPDALDEMSADDAQEYLDDHPMEEQWRKLTLGHGVDFTDDDLLRLEFLPELESLVLMSDHLTDLGVRFIRRIPGLKRLVIYSPKVTDACLDDIAALRNLETIDLQASPRITREAFDTLVSKLPNVVEVYPPFERFRSEP